MDAGAKEIDAIIRPNILALSPYRCARDDYDQGILLDANENSLGSSLAAEDLQQMQLERYPSPYQVELKKAIADYRNETSEHGHVRPDNIFLGVGSDEAIDLVVRVACTPSKDSILITPPTYGMYKVCANIHDVDIISCPLHIERDESNPKGLNDKGELPSFHIDPQEILSQVKDTTKIMFLCSPGNPTANMLRASDVRTILESSAYKGLVVVDEAYVDFSDEPSLIGLVQQYPRLVVLQTLSKAFGLAGVRLGSAIGHPRLIQILNNVKAPYNISKLTSKVGLEAMANVAQVESKIALIKSEKERVVQELRKLSLVKCIYASDSNFVLFQVPHAEEVYREMADKGVVIRYRGNQLLLTDCLRATIGSREENDSMLQLLNDVTQRFGE